MARSAGGGRWLAERRRDGHARRSREAGYRSRASIKLLEMHRRDRLFRPGMTVLDLGAAPGGWSQVAAERVAPGGRVVACDLLPMEGVPGVEFLRGDLAEEGVRERLLALAGPGGARLVMSDMAPNISGVRAVDQPRAMRLAELALAVARAVLAPGGALLVKAFQGEGLDGYRRALDAAFRSVKPRKPAASRGRSRELYLLAAGFAGRRETGRETR